MQLKARRVLTLAIAAAVIFGGSACGNQRESGGDAASGQTEGGAKKIALLLPEAKTTRYEAQDRPLFEAKVKELCPDCEVLYRNADQKSDQQQQQAEAVLTDGANVLVLDPVDAQAVGPILQQAKQKGVPVISYDRFFADADFYISFNNENIGELQGQAVLDGLTAKGVDPTSGEVWMVNGDPKDPNAPDFKKGAEKVLKAAGVNISYSYDTEDWKPENAQAAIQGQLGKGGPLPIAIYSANDGTAGGVIAALKSQGITDLPVVTGQDAEAAGLQRILTGEQFATIFKHYQPQAEGAAQAAVDLANGKDPATTDEFKGVPAQFVEATVITKENVQEVIDSGQLKLTDICTDAYKAACDAAGLK